MDEPRNGADGGPAQGERHDRLESWKKIASYLKREVSTVQRWERREGMPVHRHVHDKLGSVFAYRSELDAWWESRRLRLEPGTAPPPLPPPTRVARWRAVVRRAAAAAAFASAAALIALAFLPSPARDPLAEARFTRLSEVAGAGRAAAISRDGRLIAFFATRDGHTDAWVGPIGGGYRNLTNGALPELSDNPAVRTLGFSPDSALVLIWVRRADGSRPDDVNVFAVPVAGGAPRLYLREIAEVDWSRDGTRLVYHTTAPGDPLFVREPGAAAERSLYVAPAGVHCHFPLWSPDAAFVYFVRGVPPDDWDIWRVRSAGGGLERITHHNARVSYPVLLDYRTLLYLASDADGAGPWIYSVDVEQRAPRRLSSGLESYSSLGASTDGRRLVATVANAHTSLWRVRLTGAEGSAGVPTELAANGAAPRLGPGLIAYLAARGGRAGVWTLAGGVTRELWRAPPASIVAAPAVSPDGRRIVFKVALADESRLYVLNSDGSGARELARGLELRGEAAWAPDGSSVLAAVMRAGEPRVMRVSLDDGRLLPLVPEYSLDPVFSPDGRYLVYSGADVGTTFQVRAAAADGRPYPLPGLMLTRGARRVAFLGRSQSLVLLRGGLGHRNLALFDLATGSERVLLELPPDFIVRDFDVAADGSELVLERVEESSELALIERQP